MGFAVPPEATPNDMVVALRLEDDAEVAGALAAVDAALAPAPTERRDQRGRPAADHRVRTAACARDAVVLVSVPGASASSRRWTRSRPATT